MEHISKPPIRTLIAINGGPSVRVESPRGITMKIRRTQVFDVFVAIVDNVGYHGGREDKG